MTGGRKALIALLVVGLAGSFSSGTLATFTASTTNGSSAFSTGSLVLSNTVNSGTACLSSGTTATNNVNTDTNANGSCAAAFALATRKPGDIATASLQIQNAGTLAATTGLTAYASGACTSSDAVGETYHGTGNMCSAVQGYVQETNVGGTNTACRYGKGASGVISSTARTFPLTILATTNQFNLTVDGTAHTALTIPAASYTATTLTTALNTAISAWATAAVGLDNIIYISSKTIGASSVVTIANGATNNALPTLGFTTGASNTGGQVACSFDAVHTLTHFTATHTSSANGLAIGALPVSTTKYFVLGVTLPLAAGNDLQGRTATLGYTFTATQ